MTVKERVISIKLLDKKKRHSEFFDEIGIATNMILKKQDKKEKREPAKEEK